MQMRKFAAQDGKACAGDARRGLEVKAERLPDLRYVVIDPISVIVGDNRGPAAGNNNAAVRRALAPLEQCHAQHLGGALRVF